MAEIERRVHPEASEVQPDLFCARLVYQARGKGQPDARFVGFDTEEWNTSKDLFDICRLYMNLPDRKKVHQAWAVMMYAHQNQVRDSGERYTNHCMRVALTQAVNRMDKETVCAALMHDVLEDSETNGYPVSEEFIRTTFGDDVAKLALGCRNSEWDVNPEKVRYLQKLVGSDRKSEEDRLTLINIYRQFSGAADADPRVILIKLEDRLDNMRTIAAKPNMPKALETLEFFSNLAALIGEFEIRNELVDLSFELLNPDKYKSIVQTIYNEQKAGPVPPNTNVERHHNIMSVLSHTLSLNTLNEQLQQGLKLNEIGLDSDAIHVSTPAIYALHQTWLRKGKSQGDFSKHDIYAKVHITIPDDGLDDFNRFSTHILSQMAALGFVPHLNYDQEFDPAEQENSIFLTNRETGRLIKLKIMKKSKYRYERTQIASLFQVPFPHATRPLSDPMAEKKLQRLKDDFYLIGTAHENSASTLSAFRKGFGGVQIHDPKDRITILEKNSTILDYAYQQLGEKAVFLTGFRVNKGKFQSLQNLNRILKDHDIVELQWDEQLDPRSRITPQWLKGIHTQDLHALLNPYIKDKLAFMQKNQPALFLEWKHQLAEIGLAKFEKLVKYRPLIVSLKVAQDIYQSIGCPDAQTFLEAVAYGEIDEAYTDTVAYFINNFLDTRFAVDFFYPEDHKTHKLFRLCCKNAKMKFSFAEPFQSTSLNKKTVRYFFPASESERLTQLWEALNTRFGTIGVKRLIHSVALVTDHLPPERQALFTDYQNALTTMQSQPDTLIATLSHEREEEQFARPRTGNKRLLRRRRPWTF